jgi:hypothetical protein
MIYRAGDIDGCPGQSVWQGRAQKGESRQDEKRQTFTDRSKNNGHNLGSRVKMFFYLLSYKLFMIKFKFINNLAKNI